MPTFIETARNVFLYDHNGEALSGFWQYGYIDWDEFYRLLRFIIVTDENWAIFTKDEAGASVRHYPTNNEVVPPGDYILLTPDRQPMDVSLTNARPRARAPTVSNTLAPTEDYRKRAYERDQGCLLTGKAATRNYLTRFRATHIFPRAHEEEWNRKFSSHIIDDAPPQQMGRFKIDSVQNVVVMRGDLAVAWNNYEFGVNPDRGHVIIPFVNGYQFLAGRRLELDHITDDKHRPLDMLLSDHFLNCVMKNMKGVGESDWDFEDTGLDGNGGTMDLSQTDVWATGTGRTVFEVAIADRLSAHLGAQDATT